MPTNVAVNMRTVVHNGSDGQFMGFPDVCKTPSPAGPVPIPYPNLAQSIDTAQGTTTVKVQGNPVMVQGSCFSKSTGDEAGSAGGVLSNTIQGKAEFVLYSFDVSFDGKPVARQFDLMMGNKLSVPNTPPMPEIQPPLLTLPGVSPEEEDDDDEIQEIDFAP